MSRRKDGIQTTYCHQQASECAAAAAASAIAEVREAYLQLEQGWLSLTAKAPETNDAPIDPTDAT
jgi:hypothetical protein